MFCSSITFATILYPINSGFLVNIIFVSFVNITGTYPNIDVTPSTKYSLASGTASHFSDSKDGFSSTFSSLNILVISPVK